MDMNNLEPKEVLSFFYEICSIPHGTYHINTISDYLAGFAIVHGLKYRQDEHKNVIIWAPATPGYENEPVLAIQGHMDMVAVKDDDCTLDLEKDGLQLNYADGYLYAEKTSLGGDDGIALAYALAILVSKEIKHPAIEAIFTVNEEVGMDGALGIDMSDIKAERLLNIDSEEEGILTVSCAGGCRVHSVLPVERTKGQGRLYRISLDGLKGGHSGVNIHMGRANAAHLMGRTLHELMKEFSFRIVELEAGTKDNAIPCSGQALILVENGDEDRNADASAKTDVDTGVNKNGNADTEKSLMEVVDHLEKMFMLEYSGKEDALSLTIKEETDYEVEVLSEEAGKKMVDCLISYPDGVIAMCGDIPELVETSLNLGILKLNADHLSLDFALRSSRKTAKEFLMDRIVTITEEFGGKADVSGNYPSWEYRKDSPLMEKMVRLYKEQYGEEPEVVGVHAGLECGILTEKKPELDCVSMGPNLIDIHTTREKMDIASVERIWKYIKSILETKD